MDLIVASFLEYMALEDATEIRWAKRKLKLQMLEKRVSSLVRLLCCSFALFARFTRCVACQGHRRRILLRLAEQGDGAEPNNARPRPQELSKETRRPGKRNRRTPLPIRLAYAAGSGQR
jgi:hypothetical protein